MNVLANMILSSADRSGLEQMAMRIIMQNRNHNCELL